MYKRVSGIYAIISETCGSFYIGSAICTTGRKNCHFRELRNGIHRNVNLTKIYKKYGIKNLIFRVIERLEDTSKLREREQYHLDRALINNSQLVLNMAHEVCELASPEIASQRMTQVWKRRTPAEIEALSEKISKSVKLRYANDPHYAKKCLAALEVARNSQALEINKVSSTANLKRSVFTSNQWRNRSQTERLNISALISEGMLASTSPEERSNQSRKAAEYLWADKNKRKMLLEKRAKANKRPETIKKRSINAKNFWDDLRENPEKMAAHKAKLRAGHARRKAEKLK